MRNFLLLISLISFPIAPNSKEGPCNEGSTYQMRQCAYNKLIQSDKKLKKVLDSETFEEWVRIRHRMCQKAYVQYKEETTYPQKIMKCSVDLNKTVLKKTKRKN